MNDYGFMPHGFCYEWRPDVLWLHIVSDGAIALAYFGISFLLFYFVRKRQELPFQLVFILFSAFIILCGTTHLFSIWVLWHPNYYIEGYDKALTAVVSVVGRANAALDLLITDIGLPNGMNGRQLADLMRETAPGLPVLFITGYAGAARVDNLGAGMTMLTKPFALPALAWRVEAILATKYHYQEQ
jgi:CheY-like chemotaxis protein